MRFLPDTGTTLGTLALAAMLALMSPGVRVVRAADGPDADAPVSTEEPLTCEAPRSPYQERAVADHLELATKLQRERLAAAAAEVDAGAEIRVLDNRGYNYPPAR